MASADPSQFAPTANAAVANAANRRLMAMGSPTDNTVASPTDTLNTAPPANIPIMGSGGTIASHNPSITGPSQEVTSAIPPTPPNGINNTPVPVTAIDNTNPLSGGTGNAALDQYLGTDATYQSQLSDLMRQYDQYNAQKNLTASQTQADYDAKERALNTQSSQDQLNMRNAAAARGILYSGIYANQLGQYNDANQQQMTNLLGGLQNSKDNAALQYNQFISNEIAAKESAIQQAAARRASQLGLV